MFLAIILKVSKKRLVVPARWIKGFEQNVEPNYNFGVQKTQDYIVFYSDDRTHVPNFDIKQVINDEFDTTNDSYYSANILYVFRKYF